MCPPFLEYFYQTNSSLNENTDKFSLNDQHDLQWTNYNKMSPGTATRKQWRVTRRRKSSESSRLDSHRVASSSGSIQRKSFCFHSQTALSPRRTSKHLTLPSKRKRISKFQSSSPLSLFLSSSLWPARRRRLYVSRLASYPGDLSLKPQSPPPPIAEAKNGEPDIIGEQNPESLHCSR